MSTGDKSIETNPDFLDLLRFLNANGVEFMVVGAYALAAHGCPRNTKDIDLFYRATPDNAGRILAALRDFGFEGANLTPDDLLQPKSVIQLGYPPRRIDLMNAITGVEFSEAWQHRVLATFGDVEVPVIGKDDFVRNKLATGRLRDLGDIEVIGENPATYGKPGSA